MEAEVRGQEQANQNRYELTKTQKDLLWGEYVELRSQARHAETARMNLVNFSLLLTSALIAVITLDKVVDGADLALCLVIVVIGIFSTASTILNVERYEENKLQAACIRGELDRLFFDHRELGKSLTTLRADGTRKIAQVPAGRFGRAKRATYQYGRLIGLNAHVFWIVMPLLISAAGAVLTTFAILHF